MRSLAVLLALVCAAPAQAALLLYDGFAPVTPDPATTYNYRPGEPLAPRTDTTATPNPGQLVPAPFSVNWRYAGAGGAAQNGPTITSGSLYYPGLQGAVGNSVAHDATQLGGARVAFTAQTTGTVYWSGLLRVNSIGTLTSGGAGMLLSGYNNGAGPVNAQPGTVEAVLRIRKDATLNQYYVGVGRNSGNAAGNVAFDTTARFAGDTVFVVGAYEFVAGASNDRAHMWINPNPASFMNNALIPAPTLSVNPLLADVPLGTLASFNVRNVNTVGAPLVQFDELRVGTDWASVTPTPEPSVILIMGFVGAVIVVAGKKRMKLQALLA